jgi:hypothetical protein
MVNRYWTTTEKLLIRETATTEQDAIKLEKKAFDIESAYQRIASFTVYKGYNQAVRTKLETAIPAKGLETEVATGLTAAFSLKKIFKGGLEKLKEKLSDVFGDKLGLNRLQELELQEMFLTKEDEKVDPRICEPLNRRLFSVDDPDKPDLPMHDWCRCILVPIAGEEAHFTGLDIEI